MCTVWSTGRSCATRLASAASGGAGGAGSLAAKGGCSAEPFSSCGGGGPFLHQDSAVMHAILDPYPLLFSGQLRSSSDKWAQAFPQHQTYTYTAQCAKQQSHDLIRISAHP